MMEFLLIILVFSVAAFGKFCPGEDEEKKDKCVAKE